MQAVKRLDGWKLEISARLGEHARSLAWLAITSIMVVWVYEGHSTTLRSHLPLPSIPTPIADWIYVLYHHLATLILFGGGGWLVAVGLLGFKPAEIGIRLGEWRIGLKIAIVGALLLTPFAYLGSFQADMLKEYPLTMAALTSPTYFALWTLTYLIYYVGWEIFFRGTIGLGFARFIGSRDALFLQTALSTVVHIGKPGTEMWAAIPGGLLMGWLTLRTGSIWWAVIFHLLVGLSNTLFCGWRRLGSLG